MSDYQVQQNEDNINTLKGDIGEIRKDIKKIKNNHLNHIQVDIATITRDIKWLSKFFWIVAGASIGGLITQVVNLF